jgi:phosphatidylinositol alpha 1,6-mannosyltransferase
VIGPALRVAFFPDAYHEVDGVANTSRQLEAFARRHGLPFLTILGGTENNLQVDGSVTRMERRRGPIGFRLDKKHDFDLAFWRHYGAVEAAVERFDPDIVHVTGPSDVGQLGALVAHRLGVPLAASWHTNLHDYAEQRALGLMPFFPQAWKTTIGSTIRRGSLQALLRFYKIAQVLFAPNQELIDLIEAGTGKPCFPMRRGVDTSLFNPTRRTRAGGDFVIGYVGRLTVEKNIAFLVTLERALADAGLATFRFLIVGQGAEEPWLRANMQNAEFTGVLKGEALARAYANMDLFVFPSRTDTYGNVVMEAFASGVAAIVTDTGGPQFLVTPGETGFIARNLEDFVRAILELAADRDRLARMSGSARALALNTTWDQAFEEVYTGYERGLRSCTEANQKIRQQSQARVMARNPSR